MLGKRVLVAEIVEPRRALVFEPGLALDCCDGALVLAVWAEADDVVAAVGFRFWRMGRFPSALSDLAIGATLGLLFGFEPRGPLRRRVTFKMTVTDIWVVPSQTSLMIFFVFFAPWLKAGFVQGVAVPLLLHAKLTEQ